MISLSKMLDHIIRSSPVTGAEITGALGGLVSYPHKPLKNILSRIEHRVCRNSTLLISAVAKQQAIHFELMSIPGVPRVG